MNKDGLLATRATGTETESSALQVETADCIKNIDEIAAVPGVDILFLGQNDLCMSMGLYEKYEFPHMYTSPELNAATQSLVNAAKKNNIILGLFLFGTARVGEFLDKGFTSSASQRFTPRPHASRHLRRRRRAHSPKKRQILDSPPTSLF